MNVSLAVNRPRSTPQWLKNEHSITNRVTLALLGSTFAIVGCMSSPTNNSEVASYVAPVPIQGFVFAPNSAVEIQVQNQNTGTWDTLTTAFSELEPSLPANAVAENPALYAWSAVANLNSNSNAPLPCRWSPTCQVFTDSPGAYAAKLRALNGGTQLQTFEAGWGECISNELAKGALFVNAAAACRSPTSPEVRLRDIYEWHVFSSQETTSGVGMGAAHDDWNGASWLVAASVTSGGLIRVTPVQPAGFLSTPTLFESVKGVSFATGTAPVVQGMGSRIYVLARGTDNNLYLSMANVASRPVEWSPLTRLTDDGTVRGRISAALTPDKLHVVYVASNSVAYRRFSGETTIGATSWNGITDASIGSDQEATIAVLLRGTNALTLLQGTAARSWAFETTAERAVVSQDISSVVFHRNHFHALSAEQRRVDDVSGSYANEISHLRVPRGGGTWQTKIVGNFSMGKLGETPLTELGRHRNKLIAMWRDAANGLHAARWDDADPVTPWIVGENIGKFRLSSRPALAAHQYAVDATSFDAQDDLFAASVRGGNVSVSNVSGSMMRRDVEKQFELYNYDREVNCLPQSHSGAPTRLADAWQAEAAFISQLGYTLWLFPHWFVDGVYQRTARTFCEAREWQHSGRSLPPCNQARLPVIEKTGPAAQTPAQFCGGSVWVRAHYASIWAELGHVLSVPLGLADGGINPTRAALLGLPSDALFEAQAIFTEGINACSGSERCTGFTGWNENYDATSADHSFIYAIEMYVLFSVKLRGFIAEDVARGNTLLQRKYEWFKRYIFRGVEF